MEKFLLTHPNLSLLEPFHTLPFPKRNNIKAVLGERRVNVELGKVSSLSWTLIPSDPDKSPNP